MINANKIINQIIRALKKIKPYKIILFGSALNNKFDKESDIDLIVVLDKEKSPQNFEEKKEDILLVRKSIEEINNETAIDTIIFSKEQFYDFIKSGSSFSREINTKGKILYEKDDKKLVEAG